MASSPDDYPTHPPSFDISSPWMTGAQVAKLTSRIRIHVFGMSAPYDYCWKATVSEIQATADTIIRAGKIVVLKETKTEFGTAMDMITAYNAAALEDDRIEPELACIKCRETAGTIVMTCGHDFCTYCVHIVFNSRVQESFDRPFGCLLSGCHGFAKPTVARTVISDARRKVYDTARILSFDHPHILCPQPSCRFPNEAKFSFVLCSGCGLEFCSLCSTPQKSAVISICECYKRKQAYGQAVARDLRVLAKESIWRGSYSCPRGYPRCPEDQSPAQENRAPPPPRAPQKRRRLDISPEGTESEAGPASSSSESFGHPISQSPIRYNRNLPFPNNVMDAGAGGENLPLEPATNCPAPCSSTQLDGNFADHMPNFNVDELTWNPEQAMRDISQQH